MPEGFEHPKVIVQDMTPDMIDEVLYGAKRSNLNREIGELLSMQGADRDRLVPVLLQEAKRLQDPTRAQQVIDALTTFGLTTYGATRGE